MSARLLAPMAALALSACAATLPPTPRASEVVLPIAFRFAPDASTGASIASLLPSNDPAFRTFSEAALGNSPTLAAALARVEAARAQADRAGAERLPEIDAAASVERSRASSAQIGIPDIPGIAIDRSRTTYGANLSARWDADLFGGLRASQRAASARLDAADADAAAVRLALIAEIAGNVTDWRTLAAREQRLREDIATAEQLTSLARSRERAGIGAGADRVQAEAAAAASQTRLAALGSERARLIGRLVILTALPAAEVERRLLQGQVAPAQSPPPPPALPSTLLTNRPDVLAAGALLRAADEDVAAASARRFPRLTLSSALGLLSLGIGGLFDGDAASGSLGAEIAGPLLDFGRIRADIAGARARTLEAFANYRDAVFTGLGEAEQSYALIEAADRERAAADDEAALAERAAKLAESRFRAGLSSFVTVLDARRLATAARERAAAAQGRASRARISLWLALGGTSVA